MNLQKVDDGIYIQENFLKTLHEIDSIIFDCDGVLIDILNSYDLTIKRTVTFILKDIFRIEEFDPVTPQIIDGFKASGGFNDEVDLTYAIILSLVTANRLGKLGAEFVFDVIDNSNETGIFSVERYLNNLSVDISDIKLKLDYPGSSRSSILYSVFDQLFYGPELYHKLFKKKSQFTELGFIENDRVIVTKNLLQILKKKYGNKISIVTGRGLKSAGFSLGELLDEFDLSNSIFLENKPREMAKPNPESLIMSIQGLQSLHSLYVGDSMEDIIMADLASKSGNKTSFCGIFGTSKFPDLKRKFFEEKNCQLVLESIELLPKALNLV